MWWGTIVIVLENIVRIRDSANTSDTPDEKQHTGREEQHLPRFVTCHYIKYTTPPT
jgi:hypothetical protein